MAVQKFHVICMSLTPKAENYNLQECILFIHLNNFSYQGVNYRKISLELCKT